MPTNGGGFEGPMGGIMRDDGGMSRGFLGGFEGQGGQSRYISHG